MSADNDTLRQLLELIKELKCNHDIPAINELTNRVAKLEAHGLTARVAKLEAIVTDCNTTNRTQGYVNWNATHDILKTKYWKKLSEFTSICGSLERDVIPKFYVNIKVNIKHVDEETRFPQDVVYVNVANPAVRAEILHLKEIKKPTEGLVERFLSIAKEDMHTRSSFEEKYGLVWVEFSKY